jgi:glc operon protein GlcG
MPLNLEQAERAVSTAVAKAKEMGIALSIAVVDASGAPIALARMDGVRAFTAEVAIGKAKASAIFGAPSGRLAERMPAAIAEAVNSTVGGRAVFWQGAVPIHSGGELAGAIGASGSTSENDEIAAQAGADALEKAGV